jgi:hypothetical protein
MPLPQTLSLIDLIDVIDNNNVKQGDSFSGNPLAEVAMITQTSRGHDQSGRTRQFGQHLQNARIKLRVDTKSRRVIPEPPALRPVMHVMDHNTTQPLGPISRPFVKNPTLSGFLATMVAPSPRKSSPLGSSQHQLPLRPGFPLSKPKPDFYRRALILSEKTSRAQAGQENIWASNKRLKLKKHATSTKRRVRA